MADELRIPLDPFKQAGLTLLGKVYNNTGAQEGSTVSMTEDGPALYIGDFALGTVGDGEYAVRFETNTPDKLYGTGSLFVRNNAEVSQHNFFNGALDTVANVTTVATTTTNTDMRGTDGANTVAPDNAGITANGVAIGSLNNISTAQVQSSCDTAVTANVTIGNIDTGVDSIEAKLPTGTISDFDETANQVIVSTNNDKTNYQLANNSITSSVVADNALNNSAFTTGYYNSINSEVDEALSDYDGPTRLEATADKDEIIASLPDVSGLSTFDPSSDEVITDSASREASKADVSALGTHADLEVIYTVIKKASRLIPVRGELP